MGKAVFLACVKPGKKQAYIDYVRKNRLADKVFELAGVKACGLFVQDEYAVGFLEADTLDQAVRLLTENPAAQRFEEGEAEFLDLPEIHHPMEEIFQYEKV